MISRVLNITLKTRGSLEKEETAFNLFNRRKRSILHLLDMTIYAFRTIVKRLRDFGLLQVVADAYLRRGGGYYIRSSEKVSSAMAAAAWGCRESVLRLCDMDSYFDYMFREPDDPYVMPFDQAQVELAELIDGDTEREVDRSDEDDAETDPEDDSDADLTSDDCPYFGWRPSQKDWSVGGETTASTARTSELSEAPRP